MTLLSPNDATNQRLAQVIQQMVKDAGFAVTVQTAEFVTTLEQGREGKFDAFLNGWSGRVDPDGNVTNLITSGGTNNFGDMPDPGIDDRSENFSDSLSLFLLHRPVPAVARWSYLVSTGVLRLLKGELPGDVDAVGIGSAQAATLPLSSPSASNTESMSMSRLVEALISRSCVVPHPAHVH